MLTLDLAKHNMDFSSQFIPYMLPFTMDKDLILRLSFTVFHSQFN